MHSKSNNLEIIKNDHAEVIEEFFELLKKDVKISLKNQSKVVSLSLIMFIYCIINVIKYIPNRGGSYIDSPNRIKINKKKQQ